ncbi:MAG: UpxY family transcription antiterminator [Prevotella sp.]|nr:UpxY family transcription antiterminator [Prevotella sp.]
MKDIKEEPSIVDKAQPLTDNTPWFGIQLFGLRQKELSEYLKEKDIESFAPMHNVVYMDRNGKRKHELRPVVSNLMFVKMTVDGKELQQLMDERYKGHFYIIRKAKGSLIYYQIPAKQMHEFMIMCNPEILLKKFLTESEAKLKKGDRVMVTHGPLKGLSGRLVRSSGKYYLLKEIPGMAVMMKVTRWCCQKLEEE